MISGIEDKLDAPPPTVELKNYTVQAQHGIKGEAFFESLIADYSLPHHISGCKDIGIDFICEWAFDQKPSGVLFAVQVKTLSGNVRDRRTGKQSKENSLMQYRLLKNDHLRIDQRTRNYWNGMGIPMYLFVVALDSGGAPPECYYKRYTPALTERRAVKDEDYFDEFYLVNDRNGFRAFADSDRRTGGFARDLFIDYTRCQYSRGYLEPLKLGLNGFPRNPVIYDDSVKPYKSSIESTFVRAGLLLLRLTNSEKAPASNSLAIAAVEELGTREEDSSSQCRVFYLPHDHCTAES